MRALHDIKGVINTVIIRLLRLSIVREAIMAGKKVDKEIKVATFLIDAANVDKYGVDGWQ